MFQHKNFEMDQRQTKKQLTNLKSLLEIVNPRLVNYLGELRRCSPLAEVDDFQKGTIATICKWAAVAFFAGWGVEN